MIFKVIIISKNLTITLSNEKLFFTISNDINSLNKLIILSFFRLEELINHWNKACSLFFKMRKKSCWFQCFPPIYIHIYTMLCIYTSLSILSLSQMLSLSRSRKFYFPFGFGRVILPNIVTVASVNNRTRRTVKYLYSVAVA